LASDIEQLKTNIINIYPHLLNNLRITYLDDEQEYVTVDNQHDFLEAVDIFNGQVLKFVITERNPSQNIPMVQQEIVNVIPQPEFISEIVGEGEVEIEYPNISTEEEESKEVEEEAPKVVIEFTRENALRDFALLLNDQEIQENLVAMTQLIVDNFDLSVQDILVVLGETYPVLFENELSSLYLNHIEYWSGDIEKLRAQFGVDNLRHAWGVLRSRVDNEELSQLIQALLLVMKHFHIDEVYNDVPAQPTGHVGIICDGCGVSPIPTTRYKCAVCPDFDLCETCEAQNMHPENHPLIKIREPISGCPRQFRHSRPRRHVEPTEMKETRRHHGNRKRGKPKAEKVEKVKVEKPKKERYDDQMEQLKNMGYDNKRLNTRLLQAVNGDLGKVVEALLALGHQQQ